MLHAPSKVKVIFTWQIFGHHATQMQSHLVHVDMPKSMATPVSSHATESIVMTGKVDTEVLAPVSRSA